MLSRIPAARQMFRFFVVEAFVQRAIRGRLDNLSVKHGDVRLVRSGVETLLCRVGGSQLTLPRNVPLKESHSEARSGEDHSHIFTAASDPLTKGTTII